KPTSKMNKKTPVSILQEMMVKQGTSPSYELIHNGGGSHQNIFTYQVTCGGLSASGTGRCKKDAKHEAATAMLETIAKHSALPQLPATPCESPVRTPLPMTLPVAPKSPANVPFRNTIGELQELCSTNNLDDPQYKEISDVGPPHARIFTVQCLVSTFVEEGIAKTKKQAKHEAARKMLERISDIVPDDPNAIDSTDENQKREQMASKIAIARYPFLSMVHSETGKSKINWGLKVVNFHQRLKNYFEDDKRNNVLEKLNALSDLTKQCQNDMSKDKFLKLKQEFESIQLNTAPDIHEIGYGDTEMQAEVSALEKIIQTMKFFLQ
ncbi:hypothetical protein TSAR_016882, partial [Trichomalopsis sarcophagae]